MKFGFAVILSFVAGLQLMSTSLLAEPVVSPSAADGAKPCSCDGTPRPRVLVTEQRLEFLRADIKTNSTRRAIYKKDITANAGRWLQRVITIPEQGGWAHDFCGPDGALLELPADQQFDPDVRSRSPTTGRRYDSEKIRAARRYFEQNWLSFAARDLALAYAVEQRREYADKAAEILLKYADAYPHFIASGKGFGFQQLSICEAVSLIPMAQGYDLIYDSGALNDEQKRHIERDFFWPEAQRLIGAGLGGNWGSWHLSAVGVIGYATGHQRFIDYGVNSFKSQIAGQLGDDGLWPESVQTYHFYPLDAFLSLAEAASNCGEDLFHWQAKPGKGLEAMFESPLRYMYPTLQLPAINDGWYDAYLPGDQYAVAWWHYRKPEFAWALRRSEEVGRSGVTGDFYDQRYRLFLFGGKLPDSIPAPVFTSTNFPVLGISILRQGSDTPADREMFLTFHYGPFHGHGHYDKMGVTLFANGRPMAPGLGTPGYGSPNIRFFGGVTAHNTIATDQTNQPRTTDSDLVAFCDQPQLKLAAAKTRTAIPGTKWIRAVLLADNYAVVWDDLRGNREHTYDWFLHAAGDRLDLTGASASRPADTHKGGEFSYPFITGVRARELPGTNIQANWFMPGKMGLKVWMMAETNDPLFTARCPTTDGGTMPMMVLRKNSKDCQFVSVLQPWKGKPGELQVHTDRSDSNTLRLTITQPARTDVISFDRRQIGFDFNAGGGSQEKQINVPLMSGETNRDPVLALMQKVSDWQLDANLENPRRDTSWIRATFYEGIMAAYATTGDNDYLEAALCWAAEEGRWKMPGKPSTQPRVGRRHADNAPIGQIFAELYQIKKDPAMIQDVALWVEQMMEHPARGREEWSWCDALNVAPPVFSRLFTATGDTNYLKLMDELYWDAADFLYDPQEKLFYRDSKYFDARVDGKKVFWSRGNGWVVAGLARILEDLPKNYPTRPRYESLLRDLCARIAALQPADGLWHANLLDAGQYPNPETSGSALFIYAMAWGVNNGVLDQKTFEPVIRKGWIGLTRCVSPEGKLGFVQQIGEDPRSATMNDSQEYGAGAFLLAGSEVAKMTRPAEANQN